MGDALEHWASSVSYGALAGVLGLLDRLPDAERYRIDAYEAYGWLPMNMRRMGKGGAVNRNEG